MSAYGPQPALQAVERHMLDRSAIAWLVGTETTTLAATLDGAVAPAPQMVDRLVIVLDAAPDALFTAEALAAARPALVTR